MSVKKSKYVYKGSTGWTSIVCKTGKYIYKGVLSGQLLSVKQVSMYTKEY